MLLKKPTSLRALKVALCAALLAATGPVAARQNPSQASASDGDVVYRGVFTTDHFDVSPPLRDLPDVDPPMRRVRIEEIDVRGNIPGPEDVDQIVQQDVMEAAGEIPSTSASFNAFAGDGNVAPPDPVGDVGPNHYVAMANVRYAVYNKAGAVVLAPININTLWSGFGGPCQVENAGDPVVIHDQLANRWVLMQFTASGTNGYRICLAISTSGDPTGTFYRYSINTGTNFPDYPKLAMWPNAYIITTREFSAAGPFAGVGVYALNRAQAIAGGAVSGIGFLATPGATPYRVGDGLLPADLDGTRLPPSGTAYLLGSQDNGGGYGAPSDALNLWKLNLNFATPASSTLALTNVLPTAAFDSIFPCAGRECIPQPGTSRRLDHQGYRQRVLHRLAYRNHGTHESLVTNHSVEAPANVSGVRWYEIRNPNAAPAIYQQGTYSPGGTDGIHRWFGSIAQDQNGNMGLGYSVSNGTSVFPGIRYTGRLAGDALGTMPQGEGTIVNGAGSQTGSARWGDYTSMNVDPVDDCTLWYINEYYTATSAVTWQLRVGSFRYPSCAPRATVVSLWSVGTKYVGDTARFWALVRNDGTTPMPADSRVWFLTDVTGANAWVGSASVAGLAPGASAWYFYDYVIPANAVRGVRNYRAQVWKAGTYAQSSLVGPQSFTVLRFTVAIDQLWPVTGAIPGGTARLWALVRNTGTAAQPADSRVYFWVSGYGDVGYATISGLAAGQSRWYSFLWPIPASATAGFRSYWVQGRDNLGVNSNWTGPLNFPLGFNDPFTSSIAGWTAVTGTWAHSSGAYLYTAGLLNTGASIRRPANVRYLDYRVRTWRSGCQSCANRIMVRGTPDPLGSTNWWDDGFVFQYTADGMFSVYRTVNGVNTALQNWTRTPAVVQGAAWNLLRVVSYEDTFLFYINGYLVWAGTDASLPADGQVGIGIFRDASAGNGLWVDYAQGIPTGNTTEGAETPAGLLPLDRVSDAQQRLNAEANRQPAGDVNRSR